MNSKIKKVRKYFLNCFLLLIPVFIWNVIFESSLPKDYSPDVFWRNIPLFIGVCENVLRIIVLVLPVIMVLSLKTKSQKTGFVVFLLGVILYFASWSFQIWFPESAWSKSLLGFMAPAYTTIVWFVGIALIGSKSFFRIPFLSLIYIMVSAIFVVFHSLHAYIVFHNL